MTAHIGLCTISLYLPESQSLKDKRRVIKSIINKLHNQYNVSAAEIDYHDKVQSAQIAFVTVSNEGKHSERVLRNALSFIEESYPQAQITQEDIELI